MNLPQRWSRVLPHRQPGKPGPASPPTSRPPDFLIEAVVCRSAVFPLGGRRGGAVR